MGADIATCPMTETMWWSRWGSNQQRYDRWTIISNYQRHSTTWTWPSSRIDPFEPVYSWWKCL